MSLASTAAKLLASLDLDTKPFEAGEKRVGRSLGKMESRFSKVGSLAQKGLSNAAKNLAGIGVVAAGFVTANVVKGVQSLQDLERVTNATQAVIKSTGGAAGVTAAQVRSLASEMENLTTADDKAIQEGENMLLTFTNIGQTVFPRATKAVTNLAIAMANGDVDNANFAGSAIQVGKALNDPIKGVTALRKVGVTFTAQQQKQIASFVKQGKVAKAQGVILAELEKEFGKAGEAAGKGSAADMRRFQDAVEDAQQALATGFLPVMSKAAKFLQTELAKPETMAQIRQFGDGLAQGFDSALEFAKQIPWGTIGDSLKIAGSGARAVLDAFAGMPPWVQTAVISGWGLNKLTGGALGGIVGELAKGLVKGVLGINAGVVNVRAGAVTGAGGVGAPAGGGIGAVGKMFLVGEAIGLGLLVNQMREDIAARSTAAAQGVHETLSKDLNTNPQTAKTLATKLAAIDTGIERLQSNPLHMLVQGDALNELQSMRREVGAQLLRQNATTMAAFRASERGDANIAAAIRAIRFQTTVPITINVPGVGTRTYQGATYISRTGQTGALLGM